MTDRKNSPLRTLLESAGRAALAARDVVAAHEESRCIGCGEPAATGAELCAGCKGDAVDLGAKGAKGAFSDIVDQISKSLKR